MVQIWNFGRLTEAEIIRIYERRKANAVRTSQGHTFLEGDKVVHVYPDGHEEITLLPRQ